MDANTDTVKKTRDVESVKAALDIDAMKQSRCRALGWVKALSSNLPQVSSSVAFMHQDGSDRDSNTGVTVVKIYSD